MRWWWLAALWLLVVVGAWLRWRRGTRTPVTDETVLVANTDLLRRSERYRTLVRAQRRSLVAQLVCLAVAASGIALLLGRVTAVDVDRPDASSRDIMLCLDASGSMTEADAQVVEEYAAIVAGLKGDRIGLTLWSGAAITIFPLTDDYDYVREELDRARTAFETGDHDYLAGIVTRSRRSSQIGDGLVSCLQRFDHPEVKRSRVVILASDNDIQGPPIYPLAQAATMAAQAEVVVHGIAPRTVEQRPDERAAFAAACEQTGGRLVTLDDSGSAQAVVEAIERLQRTRTATAPRVLERDRPSWGAALTALGLVGFVLAGSRPVLRDLRVRRRR